MEADKVPDLAAEAVLVKSESMPAGSEKVSGYDFNEGVDHHKLLRSFRTSGFQATNLGLAIDEINKMVRIDKELKSANLRVDFFSDSQKRRTF